MEDQQPDTDDVTAESPEDEDADTACKGGDADADTATSRGCLGTWLVTAACAASVLFVGCAAFAGIAVHSYLADRAEAAARMEVARSATGAITALWTYAPDTIDTLPDRAAGFLSGDFDAQYRDFVDAVAAPNKQAQVTNTTDVVGVGVESLDDDEAVAIVFTNTTASSPLTQNIPSLKFVSYRLAMKHQGSRWLVTGMSTISFMDLTPKL
ncbi:MULTISPECIES: mammalian cell entry protein [Mycobacteriaceae]|uniref:Mammalian cell entry protein n=1 Tax=Mycolicibacterium gadium TaxID=1794 RepID=A0ABT6GKS9_MYCGU|nr:MULTISPECIES: mammalian cell entry protein [Mycobacteriaceae]MDG5481984.1 mammalian cell entry protein [Mycolicibacterium gadium]QEN17583.1 mammalian cell entry protein [Mycobacterium sp. ELW1]